MSKGKGQQIINGHMPIKSCFFYKALPWLLPTVVTILIVIFNFIEKVDDKVDDNKNEVTKTTTNVSRIIIDNKTLNTEVKAVHTQLTINTVNQKHMLEAMKAQTRAINNMKDAFLDKTEVKYTLSPPELVDKVGLNMQPITLTKRGE